MRLPRPRSLTSLMILGLLLLVVPLGYALTQAVTQLRRLADQTEGLVSQGVELAGESQSLFRHLSAYDRATHLYLLLGDPRLLDATRNTQLLISETADKLAALPLAGDDAALDAQPLKEATVGALAVLEFADPGQTDRGTLLAARLESVSAAANDLSANANQLLDTHLQQLVAQTKDTRQRLFLWMAAMIPVALALSMLFFFGILRPLRSIDRAITELGHGSLATPISVKGSSEIEALGRQLEWLRVRLLELAQEKNRFLRYMSHELKTPLANIREGADLLLDGAVGNIDAEQREVMDIMRLNALRLQQLIENLLSYGAWQSQTTNLDLSTFELDSVLASSFLTQKLTIATRRIRVARNIDNILLRADRAKIRLVFDNLLSNALKFTPEGGGITVVAKRASTGVTVDFADTGPGIPPQERERVFEPFYTGSLPQAGPLKGSGIGLSIVGDFVAAHGGRVELIEGEYAGAHFRISFPNTALAPEGQEPATRG